MKKLFTLFTVLLLCTASSWAATFEPEIGIPYSLKCCSSEAHTANPYLGISNGSLNGQCTESARAYLKFEPVDGQEGHYYIKVTNAGNKYFNWNNGAVLADEASTTWEFRTSYIEGAVALAPVGADSGKALNNREGTGYLRIWDCTRAQNACSHWEIIKEIYTTTYNITDPSGAVLTGQYSGEVNQAPAFSGMGYTLSNQTWTGGENHTATFTANLSFTAELPFQLSDMSEGGVRNYTIIAAFDGGSRLWYRDGTTVKSANSSIVGNPAYRWAISSAIEDNILGFKIYNQASGNYVTGNVENNNVTLGDGTLYIFNETGNGGKGFRVYDTSKLISFTSSNVDTPLTIWNKSNDSHKGSNLTFYAPKELPFTPATIDGSGEQATFASDSKFYLMTLRTYYVRGWSESGNKFPVEASRPDPILESDLWAFVGNSTDGFNIFNRAKGANVAVGLGTTPTSGSGSWGTVSTTSAQKFALMQSIGQSGSVVPVATYDNNKGLAVFNFKEIQGGSFVNLISTSLGYWKHNNAPGNIGCDLVFYEAEEYSVNITGGGDNGRIFINGTEYANGQSFFNVKGETFSYSAKNIANYKAGEVAVDGNTISLTYTPAATVNVNVIYRYTNDNGENVTLKTDETIAVQNEDIPVELSLTAEQTKAMKSAKFVVGETETPLTLPDFGTAFNSVQQLHVTSAEDINVYVDLTLRPLPTTNKLYRFYNVGNSHPYMYQNGSTLDVKATSTPGDLSEMFYVLETETKGVYNIINAKNGKGYPEITWNYGSCNATFSHNGTFRFVRQDNLSVAIGQTTQSGNKEYLHANWNNGVDHVVVWNANTNNSRWYVIEVDPTELAVKTTEEDAQRFVITQGEINCELSGHTFAEGVGNYHYTENGEDKYADIESAIYRQTTFANLQSLYISVAINQPTSGYYRILNKSTQRYVNCTIVNNEPTHTSAGITGDDAAKTIFYIDEDKNIQAYDNGAYWKGVYRMGRGTFDGGTYGMLTYKHPWQFIEGNTLGTYKLIYGNDTERKYHATGSGNSTYYAELNSDAANADAATWTLVPVTELPERTEDGSTARGNEITYAPAGTTVPATVPNVLVSVVGGGYTCNNLQLTDDVVAQFKTKYEFTTGTTVNYTRESSASEWGTICLPYAVSTDGDVAYYRFVAPVGNQTLRFEKVIDETTTANEPYLIKKGAGEGFVVGTTAVEKFSLGDDEVKSTAEHNTYKLQGVMVSTSVIDGETKTEAKDGYQQAVTDRNAYYFDAKDNIFRKLNGRFNLKAFRAYLTKTGTSSADDSSSARSILGIDISEDGQSTGISFVESEDGKTVDVVFDLNGRRLQEARKGINIINGKKVIK